MRETVWDCDAPKLIVWDAVIAWLFDEVCVAVRDALDDCEGLLSCVFVPLTEPLCELLGEDVWVSD